MKEYLKTDTAKELIYKNRENILILFSEYDKTNITITKLQEELTNLGLKIGDYTSDDKNNVLTHNESVIWNLADVKAIAVNARNLLGDYDSADTGGVLDHKVSAIRNLAISVDNSNAISQRVKTLEEKVLNKIEIIDIDNFDFNSNDNKKYEFEFIDTSANVQTKITFRSELISVDDNSSIYQFITKQYATINYNWISNDPKKITKLLPDGTSVNLNINKIWYYG